KRAYCLKTQPATGETYPKSDLFNKAGVTTRAMTEPVYVEIGLAWKKDKYLSYASRALIAFLEQYIKDNFQ
ncbi:hypothetical protein QQX85_29660, partial [Klebsiella variicola]